MISTVSQSPSGLFCLTNSQNRSHAARNHRFHQITLIIVTVTKLLTKHRHHGVERHHLPSLCAPLHPAIRAVEADVEKLDTGSKIVAFRTIKIESNARVCEGSVRAMLGAYTRSHHIILCLMEGEHECTDHKRPLPHAPARAHTCLAAYGGIERKHRTARIPCHESFVERSVVLNTDSIHHTASSRRVCGRGKNVCTHAPATVLPIAKVGEGVAAPLGVKEQTGRLRAVDPLVREMLECFLELIIVLLDNQLHSESFVNVPHVQGHSHHEGKDERHMPLPRDFATVRCITLPMIRAHLIRRPTLAHPQHFDRNPKSLSRTAYFAIGGRQSCP